MLSFFRKVNKVRRSFSLPIFYHSESWHKKRGDRSHPPQRGKSHKPYVLGDLLIYICQFIRSAIERTRRCTSARCTRCYCESSSAIWPRISARYVLHSSCWADSETVPFCVCAIIDNIHNIVIRCISAWWYLRCQSYEKGFRSWRYICKTQWHRIVRPCCRSCFYGDTSTAWSTCQFRSINVCRFSTRNITRTRIL